MVPRAFVVRFEKRALSLVVFAFAFSNGAAAAERRIPVQAGIAQADAVADVVAGIEAMSEADLKVFYLRCSREALRGRLGSGEIAFCSTGYERLLQRVFGGDFLALLAWRRNLGRVDTRLASPF
jgi:hypothetical protein